MYANALKKIHLPDKNAPDSRFCNVCVLLFHRIAPLHKLCTNLPKSTEFVKKINKLLKCNLTMTCNIMNSQFNFHKTEVTLIIFFEMINGST